MGTHTLASLAPSRFRAPRHVALRLAAACALVAGSACTIEGSELPDNRTPFTPEPPAAPFEPPQPEPEARRMVILHTNDEHSHLLGFAPNSEYPFLPENDGTVDSVAIITKLASGSDTTTAGGIVRRQYLINKLRAESADPVLLVSAGDVMMGTVFHAATADAAPDYLAMALLGYDFVTLGNHEFDFGPDTLSASIRTVNNITFGGAVPIVISNISFADIEPGGSGADLASMFGEPGSGAPMVPWAVKTMPNGLRVGVMGIVGYDAALVAGGKGNVAFSVPEGPACTTSGDCDRGLSCVRSRCVSPLDAEGHIGAIVGDVLATLTELQAAEPDVVVLLSHSGVLEETLIAQGVAAQTEALGLPNLDVIVGGHSHDAVPPAVVDGTSTILAQAWSYGRLLGKITIEVAPNGTVSLVQPESELLVVDYTLDGEIFGNTNIGEGTVSPELERALSLTTAVVAPVIGGLNAQLEPLLGAEVLDEVVFSDHPIVGEKPSQDHPLFHLVTDAVYNTVLPGACFNPDPGSGGKFTVVVQASGVIRESLRFSSTTNGATLADVFRVLPLGASPFEANPVPGFPLLAFDLDPGNLWAGVNIGVTQGLESDSFFLSYAGMRVSYDPTLPPFDPATFDPFSTEPQGRVTEIVMTPTSDPADDVVVYQFDPSAPQPWALRWSSLDPASGRVRIITNLYLAGFMEGFGLQPMDTETGVAFPDASSFLAQSTLCQVPGVMSPSCGGGTPEPAIDRCVQLSGGTVPWPLLEAKEWGALLTYLTDSNFLGGTIPAGLYDEATFTPRVIDITATP